MPKVYTTLTNIDQTILRPAIYSILTEIQNITKIKKNALILFPGDSNVALSNGTAIESDKNKEALFNATNIVHIEIQYDHDEEDITSMDAYGRYSHPIFSDTNLNVYIAPIYSKVNITINFKYRTPSKLEALRWRDDLRMKISQMRDINIHKVDYSYTLPLMYLVVLKMIHTRREAIAGYGDTFNQYLEINGSNAITLMSDSAGNDLSLAIAETQSRIVGIYDFSPLPEKPEKDSENSLWTINFSYKFTIDKPIAATMQYPVMVHNQSLPLEYVDFIEDNINLSRMNLYADGRLRNLNYFEYDSGFNKVLPDKLYIRIPEFDDYKIDQTIKSSGTILLALCELDMNDSKALLNLDELGDIAIDPDIMTFIKESEYLYITKPFFSILNISLYRDDKLVDYDAIDVDSDVNVRLNRDPDFRRQHRIRLSIICDLTLLTLDAINRLKKYPAAFKKILASINELLAMHPDFKKLGDKGRVTELEYNTVFRLMTGQGIIGQNNIVSYYNGINGYGLFKDVDPRLMKQIIDNTISTKTVAVSNILALKKNML